LLTLGTKYRREQLQANAAGLYYGNIGGDGATVAVQYPVVTERQPAWILDQICENPPKVLDSSWQKVSDGAAARPDRPAAC
jgi:hypothetical protein